ncbi:MAG: hypothetical protein HHJ16_08230 [Polaromonas sp.]|uniref:hypothetical protein n=1 Tax=Polaromonas sp. TaxID=1869339 RepID=UPI0017D72CB6|nr:hypothetical protein [Polaromonas sp.]NMM10245.1 hypothetical protein [Polaromonas sp.]
MKMQKVSFAAISLTQWILAVTLLALAACGNSVSNPSQETGEVSISGNLSLKGAEPGAWWAVTDDQGQVWKITSPSPDQIALFQQAQNHRVSMQGHRQAKYLNFEQITPSRVVTAP